MKLYIFLGLLILTLTGCSTTENEDKELTAQQNFCENNDWTEIGYKQAISGKSVRSFEIYKKKCGDNLIASSKSTFLDGYTHGIKEYCTFDNGYELATKTLSMTNICPHELREDFTKGYETAKRLDKEKRARLQKTKEQWDNKKNINAFE